MVVITDAQKFRTMIDNVIDPESPFNYNNWNYCACGHVFHVATGANEWPSAASTQGANAPRFSEDPEYTRLLELVLAAHPKSGMVPEAAPTAVKVSDLAADMMKKATPSGYQRPLLKGRDIMYRNAVIMLFWNTVKYLEREEQIEQAIEQEFSIA